jgi:hypothetical protein
VGVALLWSIRHFVHSVGGGRTGAILASLPLFWLRFIGNGSRSRVVADGASGFYFFGRRSEREIAPQDMVNYYSTPAV